MPAISRALSIGLTALVVLVGTGLLVYRFVGRPPARPEDCQETILDPDVGRDQSASGSLHLLTCPDEQTISYHLSLVDYFRRPPVIGPILSGSLELDRNPGRAPIRARWLGIDTVEVQYPSGLRISWQESAVGPVRVSFKVLPGNR